MADGQASLATLVETERTLDAALAAAKAEAAAILQRAREDAGALERGVADRIAADTAARRVREAAEQAAALGAIEAAAVRDVARYEGLGEERVRALAGRVLRALVEDGT